jgi:MFS transporter, ACS family, glucarate transporter
MVAHLMQSPPPTRARFVVVFFLCTMSFVLYLDRVCMTQAVKPIQDDFKITDNTSMSYVLMAFTLAYGLFEIPTGRWGDRIGGRRVLTRIVVWWSTFTMLTAACWGLWSLIVVRFLFGAGEAGAYPNAARVITRWFPINERGRVQGFLLASGLAGGSISPAAAAYLIKTFSWRAAFLVFGSVGAVWALTFAIWFRDRPADHPDVNAAERDLIGEAGAIRIHEPVPWREVVGNRCIWLLSVIISLSAFVSYVYFSWFSTYLQTARQTKQTEAGWLSSLVLTGGAVGLLCGGAIADVITRRARDRGRARRRLCVVAYLLAALCMIAAVQCERPWASAVLMALSFLTMFCQQPTWWSTATEVSGPHIGPLFGLMNGAGAIGALGSQFFFGWFTDWRAKHGYAGRDQWDPAFLLCAAALICAGLCWLFVDPGRRIGPGMKSDEKPHGNRNSEDGHADP